MKKISVIIITAAAVLLLGAGSVFAAGQVAKSSSVGEEAAQNFAFVDAGISPEEASNVTVEFEFEKGRFIYEVEFIADGIRYEYEIDSKSGMIVSKEMERREPDSRYASADNPGFEESRLAEEKEALRRALKQEEEAAMKEAESRAAEEAQRTAMEAQRAAEEAAQREMEAEEALRAAYEAEEEALAEAVMRAEAEAEEARRAAEEAALQAAAQDRISVEEAKSIALQHAGLSANDVVFSKAMLEWENGRLVYEVEFDLPGIAEYEYDIDIYTGEIVSAEKEAWDNGYDEPDDRYEPDDDDRYDIDDRYEPDDDDRYDRDDDDYDDDDHDDHDDDD